MELVVVDRATIEKYTGAVPYNVISICDTYDVWPDLLSDPYRKSVLRLSFQDTSDPEGYKGLTSDQAAQIISFVKDENLLCNKIILHCNAGISRSHGVAEALSIIKGWPSIYDSYENSFPNSLVIYRLLLEHTKQTGFKHTSPIINKPEIICPIHYEYFKFDLNENRQILAYCSECNICKPMRIINIYGDWEKNMIFISILLFKRENKY